MKNIFKLFIIVLLLYSCEGTNDLFQQYLDRGETIYTEKPSALSVIAGKHRVQVEWQQLSDLTVKKGRIYWNDRQDYLDVDINIVPDEINTVTAIVDNLEEGTYTFEVFSMDDSGNRSIPATKSGRVLGELYQSSLNNRLVLSHDLTATEITFNMSSAILDDYVTTEINYYDLSGVLKSTSLDNDNLDNITIALTDIDVSKHITYRAVYMPNGNSIDNFYTEYSDYNID